MSKLDKIIIGAGLYGLYSALYCAKKGQTVVVLEYDEAPFMRATYINQARVHMGYHYPRSISTALKSAGYFQKFLMDYDFCIHKKFDQVYATSSKYSWTDAEQFKRFCKAAGIRCDEISVSTYLKDGMCDGAFLTEEYTYDAHILRDYLMDEILKYNNVSIVYGVRIESITNDDKNYFVETNKGSYESGFVLNATYASVNQILGKVKGNPFNIKYELCEIILCEVSSPLKDVGITVMDGPFFSIMPFGKTGLHSLTSVTFTPHMTSYDTLPTFKCQEGCSCKPEHMDNCNSCVNRPESAWDYMDHLAKKYLNDNLSYTYKESLFSMKPILKSTEIDDSRPTVIRVHSDKPKFVSVLSGKINTVYDLDDILEES